MIPATGQTAVYDETRMDGSTYRSHVPIVAWDDEGHPLILGEHGLVPARNGRGYVGVDRQEESVVAALPGAGWRVEYKKGDGEVTSNLLVAWLVRADGYVFAVDSDSYGLTLAITERRGFHRLVPPTE